MSGYEITYTGMIAAQSAKGNLTCREDGYCGHEHMPEFNLLNMNARLYDPWTARFLSPDPYVQLPDFTQSLNRYSYCLNNPLKYIDISGKDSWYTNNKSEIEQFLSAYRRSFFPYNSMETWLKNRSGWTYEEEGLNRIDLDRMILYTTNNEILGGYSIVDNEHINLNEIVLTTYVYSLSKMNAYDINYNTFLSNDFNSRYGAINGALGYILDNCNHTYRLRNSFGQFDPHYYTSGWRGNQYVRPSKVSKFSPVFKRIGVASNFYSLYNSFNGLSNAITDRERFEYSLDMVMTGIGFIKHPATIGLSSFWSHGGKELFWLHYDNVINLQIELGIVGLPSTMPFK